MPPILKFFHLKTKSTTSSNGLMLRHCLNARNVQKLMIGLRKFRVITSILQVRKLRLLPQLRSIKWETWTHNHLFQSQLPHFSNWWPHSGRCLVKKCQDQKNKNVRIVPYSTVLTQRAHLNPKSAGPWQTEPPATTPICWYFCSMAQIPNFTDLFKPLKYTWLWRSTH